MLKQVSPLEFTEPELQKIKSKANFTEEEMELFDLREEEKTLEDCAETMHMSVRNVSRVNKKMKCKILKVVGSM